VKVLLVLSFQVQSSKFIGKISRKHAFGHLQTQMNNNVMAYIHLAKEKKYYKGKK